MLFLGIYIGLFGSCIYDVMGMKRIEKGYALVSCAQGIANLSSLLTAGRSTLSNNIFF